MQAITQTRTASAANHGRPLIQVAESDYERLLVLVRAAAEGQPGATLLQDELQRAVIVADDDHSTVFVRLNSIVVYEDRDTGKRRRIQLVLPESADIDANRISVLAPVGAALVGLSEGDEFSWTQADGRERTLAIVEIGEAPAAV